MWCAWPEDGVLSRECRVAYKRVTLYNDLRKRFAQISDLYIRTYHIYIGLV